MRQDMIYLFENDDLPKAPLTVRRFLDISVANLVRC